MRCVHVVSLCVYLFAIPVLAETVKVSSPDGGIVIEVSDTDETPNYQVSFHGTPVIASSRLGMTFKQHAPFSDGFVIEKVTRNSRDQTWTQPWGERKNIRDKHNELLVEFTRSGKPVGKYSVRFRVFDDGIGFRYEVPKQKGMKQVAITDELTEFSVASGDKAISWWIPSRGWNRYEYIYNTTPLHDVDRAHTPFTFRLPSNIHVSIHEAALVDYASMTLDQRRPGTLKADLTPWSDGVRVKTKTNFKSPWRTVQISRDAVGLLNSDIILNLNEPNKLGDVSWVKPGKYVGIWWGMHLGVNTWGSGDKHGATTAEAKRYMDFAAEHSFDGVLVEGWNIGWDGDWYKNGDVFSFTESYPDFDLAEVTAYARKKGVRLVGHHREMKP